MLKWGNTAQTLGRLVAEGEGDGLTAPNTAGIRTTLLEWLADGVPGGPSRHTSILDGPDDSGELSRKFLLGLFLTCGILGNLRDPGNDGIPRDQVDQARRTLILNRVMFEGVHRERVDQALSMLDKLLHA